MLSSGVYLACVVFLGALQIPLSSAQCQLEVPQSAISSRVAPNSDLHREYNPAKFQLLDLSFLCYSRQMPADATYKDTRVSVLYTYDGRNYSVQATMYCRGAQWSYRTSGNRIVSVEPENYRPVNLTKDGCLDCYYDRTFSQPTWCREVNPCTAYSPCENGGVCTTSSPGEFDCECQGSWTGELCTDCPLTCENGGLLKAANCSCSCSGYYGGPNCEECQLDCQNGGVVNKSLCACSCPVKYTGDQCEVCDLTCTNGGTLDDPTCSCDCVNSFHGDMCEVCDLTCENGNLSTTTCSCMCLPHYSGIRCEGVCHWCACVC